MYSSSSPSNFTLTLPSDASRAKHPDNKTNLFTVELDGGVSLPGGGEAWEAALLEVEYPHMWDTVDRNCRVLFLLADTKNLPAALHGAVLNPSVEESMRAMSRERNLAQVTTNQAFNAVASSLQEADRPVDWRVFGKGMVTNNIEAQRSLSEYRISDIVGGNFGMDSKGILQWFPSFFVDVPQGYYSSPSDLCATIQKTIRKKIDFIMDKVRGINGVLSQDRSIPATDLSKQAWVPTLFRQNPTVEVEFNPNSQRVEFHFNHNYTGFMIAQSTYLFNLLGFQYQTVKSRIPSTSESEPDFIGDDFFIAAATTATNTLIELDTHNTIYLYSDLCEYQRLGEQKVPLLGVFPVSGEHGTQNAFFFNPPTYLPVKTSHLDRITIQLGTDQNRLVDFTAGKVVVRLNIRKKREGI